MPLETLPPELADALDEFASTDRTSRLARPEDAAFHCSGTAKAAARFLNARGIGTVLLRAEGLLDKSKAVPELADAIHHPEMPCFVFAYTTHGYAIDFCGRQWDVSNPFPFVGTGEDVRGRFWRLFPSGFNYRFPLLLCNDHVDLGSALAVREARHLAAGRPESKLDVLEALFEDPELTTLPRPNLERLEYARDRERARVAANASFATDRPT